MAQAWSIVVSPRLAPVPGDHRSFTLHLRLLTAAEDECVSQRLTGLGCDYVQGFAFARPMPADAMLRWLHSHVAVD